MNKKIPQKIYGWFALALMLQACAFPSLAAPAPVPVSEPQSIAEIGTVIANTAAAAQTQTATVLPSPTLSLTPSVTPTPETPTPTFFFSLFTPTRTASVPIETTDPAYVAESGGTFSAGGSSGASAPIPYSGKPWTCIGTGKYPPNYATLPAGKEFIASWTVINTGTKTWTSNTIDFVYKSGYRHEGKIIQDLASTVAPGRKAILRVQFTAPKAPGEYSAIWTLKVGNHPFCGMILNFVITE